jgi:hypothetical protein
MVCQTWGKASQKRVSLHCLLARPELCFCFTSTNRWFCEPAAVEPNVSTTRHTLNALLRDAACRSACSMPLSVHTDTHGSLLAGVLQIASCASTKIAHLLVQCVMVLIVVVVIATCNGTVTRRTLRLRLPSQFSGCAAHVFTRQLRRGSCFFLFFFSPLVFFWELQLQLQLQVAVSAKGPLV